MPSSNEISNEQAIREHRRFRAVELAQQGWKQRDIAQALGVTEGAVSQWLKKAREQGKEARRHRKPPGRPPALGEQQRAELKRLLQMSPLQHGFQSEVWTRKRVAVLIKNHFGVSFSESHVGNILRSIGMSRQRPTVRASQRDEAAIEAWKKEVLPELKKKGPSRMVPPSSS